MKKCKYANVKNKCCLIACHAGKWVVCKGKKCPYYSPK